ncbi:unnamed protein product [Rotaria magnacalcarata]|uniref:LIM zinc-binding domain-containing protein n=1 Tax=Rotaria magnacalcarata TaxID=392030 RepID=A0A816SKN5_9BILA|nr:unnamed protein product [Rotaria magnacalcarata]CAF4170835.1 unnamed protein product [Rotaria magnacalcarata]
MSIEGKYCAKCKRVVHPSKELHYSNRLWHSTCFACEICDLSLAPDTVRTDDEQTLYCATHFTEGDKTIIEKFQSPLIETEKAQTVISGTEEKHDFSDPVPMDTEQATKSTSELDASKTGLSQQCIEGVMNFMNSAPELWSIEEVSEWLSSIGLEEVTEKFRQNAIDGSLLMSDGLDAATLKELISVLKLRIVFNSERMKLKSSIKQSSATSTSNTNDIHVTIKPISTSDTELQSGNNNESSIDIGIQTKNIPSRRNLPPG